MDWTLHFLQAEGTLAPWRERLTDEARRTHDGLAALLAPDVTMPRIDVLIQRLPGRVIPELGLVGHSYRRGCFGVTLDPDNPAFATSLDTGQFGRTLAHEVHHCLRYASVGYGATLGEALVSEGLADQFDREAHGGTGQLWDHALAPERWTDVLASMEPQLKAPRYDHIVWFFGREGETGPIPRWAGYTVGYHLVGAYLDAHPRARPSRMAGTPAADVLADAWPRLKAAKGTPTA